MKSGRIAVLAAATVLVTASSVGAIGVGTASAQSYTYLCINNPADVTYCAVADGSSAVKMETEKVGTTTNWYWPAEGTGIPGTIEQAGPTVCMQVDADGGDIVIEAACNTEPYQEWYNLGPDPYGEMQFQSEWNPNECLTYDADGAELKVGGCGPDWYQGFFPA